MAQTTNFLDGGTAGGGGIVFNEIHFAPQIDHDGDGDVDVGDQWIEFHNTSTVSIDVSGWEIWGFNGTAMGVLYTFPPGTNIPAGGKFVVVDNQVGSNALANIGSPGDFSDVNFQIEDAINLYLHDTGENEHVVLSGSDTSFDGPDQTDFLAANSGSTLIGTDHLAAYGNVLTTSPNSFQRNGDGEDTFITTDLATAGTANLCFAAGTLIATPQGDVTVETLKIGDTVLTADGKAIPVKWLGLQTVRKSTAGAHMQPVKIAKDALGDGVPHSDLTVTSDHGMIVDNYVINAAALVNGDTINWVAMRDLADSFVVYHVETADHDVILANGAAAETFVDATTRAAFDNYQEYLDLYGVERIIPEMAAPRITSQRLLPQSLKAKLGLDAKSVING